MARKSNYIPPEYKIQVNCIVDVEQEVNELFNGILKDYCKRFSVKVKKERLNAKILLSIIQGGSDPGDMDGLCAFEKNNKVNTIAVQVRCMVIENIEPSDYACNQWIEILAHEFTHVCQCLTGRSMDEIKYNKLGIKGEDYYFDPDEVEARILQGFYANRIAGDAVTSMMLKFTNAFEDDDIDELFELQALVDARME